jgi:hypothetical protein
MEDNCDGTLTYNDHPMGFNAYAIIDNAQITANQLKKYCINEIKKANIPQNEYDNDQLEALEFFGI